MARIACTRIGVAAPGLRPTAEAAPMPIKSDANGRAESREADVNASAHFCQ